MGKKNKIFDFIKLLRVNNCIIGGFGVFVSYLLVRFKFNEPKLYLGILSVFFVMAGGNIVNDLFDLETDRINKPERPLINSRFNIKFIIFTYFLFSFLSIFISLFLSFKLFLIVMFSTVILFFYSYKLKRIPFIGNFIISLLSGLLFIFGSEIAGDISKGIFPAIFAFLLTLGREILKDIEDIDGDKFIGRRTLPIVLGEENSLFLAIFVFFILIILTFIPYLMGTYNVKYMLLSFFGVDIVLMVLLLIFYIYNDIKTKRLVNTLIKYDMFVGLLALFFGGK
uniref:Geranylgeranylglycerol-phosphate geranylgeranyltransferase n=1 Tax=candidate division WOR-3 bacterium TaxID=2052148 RepID=A0A7C3J5W5_UNCW3